jgi:hypothetical protein
MAQHLYNIGLPHEKVHWSRNKRNNSNSFPMDLQRMGLDDNNLEQQFRATRHLSSPLILPRRSVFRNENISFPGLSLHIQSMKKSAFKMLCKFSFP